MKQVYSDNIITSYIVISFSGVSRRCGCQAMILPDVTLAPQQDMIAMPHLLCEGQIPFPGAGFFTHFLWGCVALIAVFFVRPGRVFHGPVYIYILYIIIYI